MHAQIRPELSSPIEAFEPEETRVEHGVAPVEPGAAQVEPGEVPVNKACSKGLV